jgi:hypothetical protein
MRYPKLRELKEAVISLVTPAYTSKFPAVEHVPFKDFRGKPVVDDSNVGWRPAQSVNRLWR